MTPIRKNNSKRNSISRKTEINTPIAMSGYKKVNKSMILPNRTELKKKNIEACVLSSNQSIVNVSAKKGQGELKSYKIISRPSSSYAKKKSNLS